MSNGYIKKSIDAVKKYLAEVNNNNKLNDAFNKYYSDQQQDMKNDVIKTVWYEELSKNVKGILDGSKLYNDQTERIYGNVIWKKDEKDEKYGEYHIGYKGSFSIQFPAILTQLCKIYEVEEVEIKDKIYTKLGYSLDQTLTLLVEAEIKDNVLTFIENAKMEIEWKKQKGIVDELSQACRDLLTALRKKIADKHKGKFGFFESLPNDKLSWNWDDDAVYDLVSQLDEFKSQSKKMLLEEYKKKNKDGNFDVPIKQPAPDLFNLLEDKDLKTHIDNYRQKPLEERAKDPLRMIFRCNRSTQNYNLNNITKNKTIKQWFEENMKNTKDKKDIYFVLLELFGKDFEFGGNYDIPKAKLWDKVDEKEVREWYRKNMPDTDLFDDLKKIEKKDDLNINIVENNLNENNIDVLEAKNEYDKEKDKPNKIGDSFDESGFKSKEINTDIEINRNRSKRKRKKSKTSNLVYKIGLFLDILITALLVYLAIKISLLFLISLVVTLPIGIFCAIKLCGCCLGSRATTITSPYNYGNGNVPAETIEPEYAPNQNNISLEGLENNEKGKPVTVIIKTDK